MTKTIPDERVGKPSLGYVLLALPSMQTRAQIGALLDELSKEIPGVLWPMPQVQLHFTLCVIIQPKPYSEDKEKLFSLHREDYVNVPDRILSAMPKFTITLDAIEASPQAIIVRSSDPESFNTIRSQLMQHMQLPAETKAPPDIIHSSIARYMREVDLERIQETVARHSIAIKEVVSEFKLIRVEVPPLQKYTVVKRILYSSSKAPPVSSNT